MAAQAAAAAHRRDWALAAIDRVLAADPKNRLALRAQAVLYLEAGDAGRAAQLLAGLGEETLAKDPMAARTYARALTEGGLEVRVEDFVEAAVAAGREQNTPAPAVAAVRGWADAPPTAARAGRIAARVDRLLERWPDLPALLVLRAEALARAAELGDPAWDPVTVGLAVQAWARVRAADPDSRAAAAALARLRLSGENNPDQAARDGAPLLAAEADPTLTPADLELIGAVYRTTGKLDAAARVLERATQGVVRTLTPAGTAGCWVQLALTYHAQGKRPDAQNALRVAASLPRTSREQADYVAAAKTIFQ
jgi:tetratricopeptide (TPR) repeat protein